MTVFGNLGQPFFIYSTLQSQTSASRVFKQSISRYISRSGLAADALSPNGLAVITLLSSCHSLRRSQSSNMPDSNYILFLMASGCSQQITMPLNFETDQAFTSFHQKPLRFISVRFFLLFILKLSNFKLLLLIK